MNRVPCAFVWNGETWHCPTCGFVASPTPQRPHRECRPPHARPVNAPSQPRTTHPPATCKHRGLQQRTVKCGLCGARDIDVPVFACAIHGECTLRLARPKGERLKCCLRCEEKEEENDKCEMIIDK